MEDDISFVDHLRPLSHEFETVHSSNLALQNVKENARFRTRQDRFRSFEGMVEMDRSRMGKRRERARYVSSIFPAKFTAIFLTFGRTKGQDAEKLLQMRSKKAEEWINKNLPPHPNPGSLTRRSPLPGPPGVSRTSATPSSLPAPLPLRPLESQISTLTAQARLDETVLPSPIRLYITGFSHDIPAATFHEFAADSGVDLYDTYIVRMTRDNAMICTVSTKVHMDRLIEIVEKPWDPDIRVQLALPRDVHLAHYHVRVRGLSQNVRPQTLHRWAKRSRCAPFDAQVGRSGGVYLGLFRVETEWGAKEACRLLSEATAEHPPLIATWGKGRGPVLESTSTLPSHLPAKPLTNHAKASYSRPLFPQPSALSSQNATPLDISTSIDPSPVSDHSRCSSPPIHTPSIIVKSCSPLPLPPFSLPPQLPSNEECDKEISSPNSQPDIGPSQSSPSPRVTPSTSIETISTSPEPLPFVLPQPKPRSPVKALSSFPPDYTSAQIVGKSHEPAASSLSSSSTGSVPILDERVEFANLVAKRLVEGVKIGESFLFSLSRVEMR